MNTQILADFVKKQHDKIREKAYVIRLAELAPLMQLSSENDPYERVLSFHTEFKIYRKQLDELALVLSDDTRNDEAYYLVSMLNKKLDEFENKSVKEFSKIASMDWPLHSEIKIF